ncbi:MAG: family 78 glycoside hydrolase catalytic domain [Victivallales bacterium]|nr:family 78 glycoside hydrolase catalytic domain [Victivallales bacterium]
MMMIEKAQWLSVPEEVNSLWIFSKVFVCGKAQEATLEIAGDKDVAVFINGAHLPFSQLADVPGEKSVTTWNVSLKQGGNVINVQLFNLNAQFAVYDNNCIHGFAAVIYAGDKLLCATDSTWRFRRDEAYLPLDVNVTPQVGKCFCYDARRAFPWQGVDAGGENAVPKACHPRYFAREVPPLVPRDLPNVRLVQFGYIKRTLQEGTFAEICQADFLRPLFQQNLFFDMPEFDKMRLAPGRYRNMRPQDKWTILPRPENTDGVYVTIDLGRETVGFLKLSVSAPSGTIVDIAHGEHLDDGRVRCNMGRRNFADRYICKGGGMEQFCHRFRRMGARYLELHITNYTGAVTLGFTQIQEQNLPLGKEADFECEDRLMLLSRAIGIHTMKCCMHEHYEDCPWREQALYAYDSRNQALFGYYAWGNYKFARACLSLLGKVPMENGQLAITAPRHPELAIEVFTLVWIIELYEYYLYSGDFSLAEGNKKGIFRIVDAVLARYDEATGLYCQFNDAKIWRFFEWIPGMTGHSVGAKGNLWLSEKERFNACFNGYFLEVLTCVNKMFGNMYAKEASALAAAIRKYFRMENGYFRTGDDTELLHQHTQALMLDIGVVSPDEAAFCPQFFQAYADQNLLPATFSAMPYFLRAWMEVSPESRLAMDKFIRENYDAMVLKGASTFWETDDGGDAFDYAGSLCHAWSSLPVYYCHRYILGVMPMEPGFKRFQVKPYPGSLTHASGTVPTPYGEIHITWKLLGATIHLQVECPPETQAVINNYPEFPVTI